MEQRTGHGRSLSCTYSRGPRTRQYVTVDSHEMSRSSRCSVARHLPCFPADGWNGTHAETEPSDATRRTVTSPWGRAGSGRIRRSVLSCALLQHLPAPLVRPYPCHRMGATRSTKLGRPVLSKSYVVVANETQRSAGAPSGVGVREPVLLSCSFPCRRRFAPPCQTSEF